MSRPASLDLYPLLRLLLFRFDPESAHRGILGLLRLLGGSRGGRWITRSLAGPAPKADGVDCLGLHFPNRLGLAAGYDKDGAALRGLSSLGFGHLEIGTVTRQSQPGNPRPRLFRQEQDQALINRLGFPSRGAASVARALRGDRPPDVILGVHLGQGALGQVKRSGRGGEGRRVVGGCGGGSSAEEMRAMLDAGASLVQIYSALVYQGPRVVGRLLTAG